MSRPLLEAGRGGCTTHRGGRTGGDGHTTRRGVRRTNRGADRGQASVELVALLPLAAVIALSAGQVLAAGQARELAGNAAGAAAVALIQGTDAREAARDALPGWSRDRVTVRVDGRRVLVALRPREVLPGLSGRLTARAAADAGPIR